MAVVTFCPHCKGEEIYHQRVQARGERGPDLLPGIGEWFAYGEFDLYVCAGCGHAQFFVTPDRLDQLRDNWEKVETRLRRGPASSDDEQA